MSIGPEDGYASAWADAERDAWRKGYPMTKLEEAEERGYQPGVDDQ